MTEIREMYACITNERWGMKIQSSDKSQNGDLHVPARGFPFTSGHVSTFKKPNCITVDGKNDPMRRVWNTTMLNLGKAYAHYVVPWPDQSVS